MNKKGFTLIELLAVIVILAIIAVIATPIVLNIINESKENARLRSAEMYLNAVEQSVFKWSKEHSKSKERRNTLTNLTDKRESLRRYSPTLTCQRRCKIPHLPDLYIPQLE